MATTTNFGWTTPDDTALVKDGASAIRTLGSGIDTSLVDLKGGTTGQVLSKATNTDLDFTWVSNRTSFIGVSAKRTTNQTINSASSTTVNFDGEDFDTDAFHSTATNTSRITIPSGLAGKYLFTTSIEFSSDATGYRRIAFQKNGTTEYRATATLAASGSLQTSVVVGNVILDLAVGDYVEVIAQQDSGSQLNLTANSLFQAQYLGA